ncbi:MAG TPA: cyclic nucleotide-binding domain-containing protein [Gammaproteobacteria bacterium]|nr:cyclic nucleotide-binding domain-containing protein [Gammaproteobacteria bacterium]
MDTLPRPQPPFDCQPAVEPDPDALARFLACCRTRTVPARHLIIKRGEPADRLYYLVEGSATVLLEDETDPSHEIILAYLQPGEFIGEIGLFYETGERNTLVRARTACRVAHIRYDRLRELFATHLRSDQAAILQMVGMQIARRLLSTSRRLGQLAFMDVAGRVARALLELCEDPEATPCAAGTELRISRQELARLVGCSREMAGRVLKSLAEQGLVTMDGRTIVVHHERESGDLTPG